MSFEFLVYHKKNLNDLSKHSKILLLGASFVEKKDNHLKEQYNQLIIPKRQSEDGECTLWIKKEMTELIDTLEINKSDSFNKINFQTSFSLYIPFRLSRPYLSKDDEEIFICDNPIRKDKVFKVPMVAPSGWKGALHSAMVRELVNQAESLEPDEFAQRRFRLSLLFGDEKGEEEYHVKNLAAYLDRAKNDEASDLYRDKLKRYFNHSEKGVPHHKGRLYFYPTFFNSIGLEVINPHDRTTGAGTLPIYIESVPIDTNGTFSLLYFPFDRIGREDAGNGFELSLEEEMEQDLKTICRGIRDMFTKYGFGAKTSSGFGIADIIEECVDIKMKGIADETELLDDSVDILMGRKEVEDA